MTSLRLLGALFAITVVGGTSAFAQCTAQQGFISVTLDNADPGLATYTWTILNDENGNGNRLTDAFFEIAAADTTYSSTSVATWTRSLELVDGTWSSLRFTHSSGPRICAGGGSCSSLTESFTYTLDSMVSSVRIRTVQANGHQENFSFDESLAGCSGLPVELSAFDVLKSNGQVRLTWSTESEQNLAGFVIERRNGHAPEAGAADMGSSVSGEFERVAFVPSEGSPDDGQTYYFDYATNAHEATAYRLRMVDANGTFAYSSVVEVPAAVTLPLTMSDAYPNPFASRATMTLTVAQEQYVRVDVFDVTGRRVATPFAGSVPASRATTVLLDGSTLVPGLYVIRARGEHVSSMGKVVVVGS